MTQIIGKFGQSGQPSETLILARVLNIVLISAYPQVLSFDEYSGIMVCESGCVLEALANHLVSLSYTNNPNVLTPRLPAFQIVFHVFQNLTFNLPLSGAQGFYYAARPGREGHLSDRRQRLHQRRRYVLL